MIHKCLQKTRKDVLWTVSDGVAQKNRTHWKCFSCCVLQKFRIVAPRSHGEKLRDRNFCNKAGKFMLDLAESVIVTASSALAASFRDAAAKTSCKAGFAWLQSPLAAFEANDGAVLILLKAHKT